MLCRMLLCLALLAWSACLPFLIRNPATPDLLDTQYQIIPLVMAILLAFEWRISSQLSNMKCWYELLPSPPRNCSGSGAQLRSTTNALQHFTHCAVHIGTLKERSFGASNPLQARKETFLLRTSLKLSLDA